MTKSRRQTKIKVVNERNENSMGYESYVGELIDIALDEASIDEKELIRRLGQAGMSKQDLETYFTSKEATIEIDSFENEEEYEDEDEQFIESIKSKRLKRKHLSEASDNEEADKYAMGVSRIEKETAREIGSKLEELKNIENADFYIDTFGNRRKVEKGLFIEFLISDITEEFKEEKNYRKADVVDAIIAGQNIKVNDKKYSIEIR